MALTVREACDVNLFLDWFLGCGSTGKKNNRSEEDAKAAMQRLAHKAAMKLVAGHTSSTVKEYWDRHR